MVQAILMPYKFLTVTKFLSLLQLQLKKVMSLTVGILMPRSQPSSIS